MRMPHDEYFLQLVQLVANRSTCVRRDVGAIIVSAEHQVLSTGYNGVPRGFDHCIDDPCNGAMDPPGDTRRCMAVHAEVNAIIQCHRIDLAHTLYSTCTPCFECAKMIANTPIRRVVALATYPSDGPWVLASANIQLVIKSAPVLHS